MKKKSIKKTSLKQPITNNKTTVNKTNLVTLFWTTRLLSTLYIIVFTTFAIGFFAEYPLFFGLAPSIILIVSLILAWKSPLQGGVMFMGIGLLFTAFFRTYTDMVFFTIISLTLFIIGILFLKEYKLILQNSKQKSKKKKSKK